ncbi:hypothetical protein AWU65_20420 [Paenibacillus glucanolyticus]|uniref:Acyltransferase 3 domain-containing protein n=1 Tax=Paenibacillus glucanolyticus TaxID=59843 RepID=A0A163LGX3_9BACL|nr:acyltransferase [Paenibacillus glucanolyticus]KZS48123.1 hypothetical protein AWU65_20420 [Paenibacillus glucanolyticus]
MKLLAPVINKNNVYLNDIEAFRGIAALLVFYFHANMHYFHYFDRLTDYNLLLTLFFEGHTGVSLFFVISGFLLSMSWVNKREINLKQYYINRLIRILPLYYISLVFFITVQKVGELSGVIPYFLFLHNTGITKADLGDAAGIYWSLGPEVHFYIILPFLMLYFNNKKILYGLILISLIIKSVFPLGDSIFGRIDQFLIGVLACDIYFNKFKKITIQQWKAWTAFLLASIGLIILLKYLSSLGGYKAIPASTTLYTFYRTGEALLWATILVSFMLIKSKLKIIVTNPMTTVIGLCSYSVYIWHYLIIFVLKDYRMNFHLVFQNLFGEHLNIEFLVYSTFIILPVVLLVAFASYLYIERPFLLLKKGHSKKVKDSNSTTPIAPEKPVTF